MWWTASTRGRAGRPSLRPHSLRSGLVTSAVKRGVNLLKICDQTRYESVEMLRTYCRDAELCLNGVAFAALWNSDSVGAFAIQIVP